MGNGKSYPTTLQRYLWFYVTESHIEKWMLLEMSSIVRITCKCDEVRLETNSNMWNHLNLWNSKISADLNFLKASKCIKNEVEMKSSEKIGLYFYLQKTVNSSFSNSTKFLRFKIAWHDFE